MELSTLEMVAKVMQVWLAVGKGMEVQIQRVGVGRACSRSWALVGIVWKRGVECLGATAVGGGGMETSTNARSGRFQVDLQYGGFVRIAFALVFIDGICNSSTMTLLRSKCFGLYTVVVGLSLAFLSIWLRSFIYCFLNVLLLFNKCVVIFSMFMY